MHPLRIGRAVSIALAVFTLAAAPVRAGLTPGWMATDPGTRWIYVSDTGLRDTVVCRGLADIGGTLASMNEFVGAGLDMGLQQFWQNSGGDPSGDLLFLGFYRLDSAWGVRYVPPLRFMHGPPSVGRSWIEHADAFSVPDGMGLGPIGLAFDVLEQSILPPLGVSWGVDYTATSTVLKRGGRTYSVLGHALGGSAPPASHAGIATPELWLQFYVGEVQYWQAGGLYRLETFDSPVPVAGTTWGRIKRLYR